MVQVTAVARVCSLAWEFRYAAGAAKKLKKKKIELKGKKGRSSCCGTMDQHLWSAGMQIPWVKDPALVQMGYRSQFWLSSDHRLPPYVARGI